MATARSVLPLTLLSENPPSTAATSSATVQDRNRAAPHSEWREQAMPYIGTQVKQASHGGKSLRLRHEDMKMRVSRLATLDAAQPLKCPLTETASAPQHSLLLRTPAEDPPLRSSAVAAEHHSRGTFPGPRHRSVISRTAAAPARSEDARRDRRLQSGVGIKPA